MTETAARSSVAPRHLIPPAASRLLGLVDELTTGGALSQEWRTSFLAVPRHRFVPDVVWREDEGHEVRQLRRVEQPQAWLDMVYRDAPVVTQINDVPIDRPGHGRGESLVADVRDVVYSSSASMPSVVARMLTALHATPGMNVLEIGTGTGWNTALLAHRLGHANLTSVEIDPGIAAHARDALAKTGYSDVAVITGDGTLGYPGRALYDRVLSTAACQRVPYPWIAQTRPGGLVLTPWSTDYYNGHLLALTVQSDGTALGRIVGQSAFMAVRNQRIPRVRIGDVVTDASEQDVHEKLSRRHPRYYVATYDAKTAIGVQVPHCKFRYTPPTPQEGEPDGILWLLDQHSGAWAAIHHQPGQPGPYRVRQHGPRQLFNELSTAYQHWKAAGKPPADAWRITVTPEGQHTELNA